MGRLYRFRRELLTLWRAFIAADTPLHLKALILVVPLYLLSPLDLIPDIIPLAGLIDDLIIIPLLVGWIASLLARHAAATAPRQSRGTEVEGKWRRL